MKPAKTALQRSTKAPSGPKDGAGSHRRSHRRSPVTESRALRERMEKALAESEKKFRILAQTAPVGIYLTDSGGKCNYVNDAWCAMAGLSPEEAHGDGWIQGLHPEDRERISAHWEKMVSSRGKWSLDYRFIDREGKTTWVSGCATEILNGRGEVRGYLGINTDITDRKRTEDALNAAYRFLEMTNRNSEMLPLLKEYVAEIKDLTGCSAVGIRLVSPDGKIPYQVYEGFDAGFCELEGCLSVHRDSCICLELVAGPKHPDAPYYSSDGSFYVNSVTSALSDGPEDVRNWTHRVCIPYGFESAALVPVRLGDRIMGLIHIADPRPGKVPPEMVRQLEAAGMQLAAGIDRVRAAEMLRKSHAELENRVREQSARIAAERQKLFDILDELPAYVCLISPDCTFYYTNRMFRELFGDPQDRHCYAALFNYDAPCPGCQTLQVFEDAKPRVWPWTSPAGRIYQVYDYPFKEADGSLRVLELGIDITDRIHAEEELRRSEESYRLLADTMMEGLGASDENFVWTYVNDRLCEMLGYPKNEVIGHKVTEFVEEDGLKILEAQRARRMEGQEKPYEITWTKRGGEKVAAIISPRAMRDSEGRFKGSFAVITDITVRRRAEEALRESERQLRDVSSQLLAAQETERRRISRELHDELGQSLTIMKLRLGLVAREVRKDQAKLRREVRGTIVHLDQTIEEVRRLSRDLSPSVLEDLGLPAGLRRLVKEFVKLNKLKVSLHIAEGIDKLLTKDAEIILYRVIQEALTNIGKHAKAGKIRLAIERQEGDVRVLVEDDGIGFDPAHLSGPERARTGLGLAIMRQRVHMLGGQLELWSERGKGTRLSFSIPLARTPGAGSESRNVEPQNPGSILSRAKGAPGDERRPE